MAKETEKKGDDKTEKRKATRFTPPPMDDEVPWIPKDLMFGNTLIVEDYELLPDTKNGKAVRFNLNVEDNEFLEDIEEIKEYGSGKSVLISHVLFDQLKKAEEDGVMELPMECELEEKSGKENDYFTFI